MANDLLSSVQQESLEIGGGIDPNFARGMLRHVLPDSDFEELSQ